MDPALTPDLSERDSRTRLLLGDEAMHRLAAARVLVAGVGGVGGYAAEILARTGVKRLTLIDADCVAPSNLNRQLIARVSTLGEPKVHLFKRRFLDINPDIEVDARRDFIVPEEVPSLLDEGYDYVVDAIDTVAPKVSLIAESLRRGVRIVSSMGAGGRTDPSRVGYFDLWETREDGLARAVRQRLKKLGLRRRVDVVASTEAPHCGSLIQLDERNKRSSYGTVAAIPAIFGIMLAQKVINSIVRK